MNYYGRGVDKNYEAAKDYFESIIESGSDRQKCDAKYMLGLMYYNGRGVKKDYQKALNSFKVVAENGMYKDEAIGFGEYITPVK